MPPDDNDYEIFSREYDRVYGTIEAPNPDGTIHTHIIPPIDNSTFIADRDGDWSGMFSTSFLEYTNPGRLETDRGYVRIQGLDLVGVIKQLSNEEKREVLKLLLEAFDKAPEEKSITTKKVDRLREVLAHRKNDVTKSS